MSVAAAASFGPRVMSTRQRHHRLGHSSASSTSSSSSTDDERWAMLKKSTFEEILNALLTQTNIQLPPQLTPSTPPSSSSSSSSSSPASSSSSAATTTTPLSSSSSSSSSFAVFLRKREDDYVFARDSFITREFSAFASSLLLTRDPLMAEGEDPEEGETGSTDSRGASRDRQPETRDSRSSVASGNELPDDAREFAEFLGVRRSSEHVLAKCSDCRTYAETAAAAGHFHARPSNTKTSDRTADDDTAVDRMTSSSLPSSGREGVALGNAPSDPRPTLGGREWIVVDKRILFWIVERVLDGESVRSGFRIAATAAAAANYGSLLFSLQAKKNTQRTHRRTKNDDDDKTRTGRQYLRWATVLHAHWPGGSNEEEEEKEDEEEDDDEEEEEEEEREEAKCRAGSSRRDIPKSLDIHKEEMVKSNLGMTGYQFHNEAECAIRSVTENAEYLRSSSSLLVTTTTTTTTTKTSKTSKTTDINSSESLQSSLNVLNRSPGSYDVIECEECDVISHDSSHSSFKWKSEMITRLEDETRSRQSLADDDENSRLLEEPVVKDSRISIG